MAGNTALKLIGVDGGQANAIALVCDIPHVTTAQAVVISSFGKTHDNHLSVIHRGTPTPLWAIRWAFDGAVPLCERRMWTAPTITNFTSRFPAAVPVRGGVLVSVPSPARFALHKLVVSRRRPAAFHTKAQKDVRQAREVLVALIEDRPGDVVLALEAAHQMPPKFTRQLRDGLQHLDGPELRSEIENIFEDTRA